MHKRTRGKPGAQAQLSHFAEPPRKYSAALAGAAAFCHGHTMRPPSRHLPHNMLGKKRHLAWCQAVLLRVLAQGSCQGLCALDGVYALRT